MKRIAIIGSGISGLGAAYALKDRADVTVFEARNRAGGHAHTVRVDYDGKPIAVDVGFIVYNGLNYPNLIGFFDALGVATEASDMSFAVSNPTGYEWASSVKGIFAQKRNLFRPAFHRFWRTILKFNDIARSELAQGSVSDVSLGTWLDAHGFNEDFKQNYILPMAAAIWSTPERGVLDFPATSFFQFFENHRLMHKERPKWRTVSGGSKSYVSKVSALLGDRIKLGAPVNRVSSFGDKLRVDYGDGANDLFDDVIFACHSNQTQAILDPEYDEQKFLLGSARYRPNTVYLHRDASLMPKRKAAWASWNVMKGAGEDITLTYWMNRLQNLPNRYPLFVTLNPDTPPASETVFYKTVFDHPQFDAPAEAAVRSIKRLQGQGGIWFAGAWLGHGFHEDGLKSGLSVALSLGGTVSWETDTVRTYEAQSERPSIQLVKKAGQ
ncbi:MAG: FAD-dependent oxidoreductase [Pseudomonadota bacterium]